MVKITPNDARMRMRPARATPALFMIMGGASLLLAACSTGAPTYGTGTPADVQLLDDVSGALSLGPKRQKNIDYNPRPGIVLPSSTEVLPPPQDDLATNSNPKWPESPEQRLARVRAEATLNGDNPAYDSGIAPDDSVRAPRTLAANQTRWATEPHDENPKQTRRAFKRRLAASNQGNATTRRYLSEPPLVLRKPADTAPVDDLGEDEWKKKRDAERAARNKSLPARVRDRLGL